MTKYDLLFKMFEAGVVTKEEVRRILNDEFSDWPLSAHHSVASEKASPQPSV